MKKKPVLFMRAFAFIALAFVIGLTGPAFAKDPNVVLKLDEILDRLESLENKLQGVSQNWDKKLDAANGDVNGCNSTRFTCLWPDGGGNFTAVRDNETGLVWDRSPEITGGPNQNGSREWTNAIDTCTARAVGGRRGFHLPMKEQLGSLVDTSNDPALPAGHPFQNVQSFPYWTATSSPEHSHAAANVDFSNGGVGNTTKDADIYFVWCVRGGQSYDGQEVQSVIDMLP